MESKLQNSIEFITQKTGGKSGFALPSNYFETIEDSIQQKIEKQSSLNTADFKFVHEQIKGNTGFTIPSDYFENVEDSFDIKLTEENFTKTKGFELPDAYFENLEDTILAKVSPTEKVVKVISLKQRVLKLIPMVAAASIILFIGLNSSFLFNKTSENMFDSLADSEIENWISNNINLINNNDLVYTYNDIDIEDYETIPNSISNDELESYLSNQNDLSLILEND